MSDRQQVVMAAAAALVLSSLAACEAPVPQAWAPPARPDPQVAANQARLARPFVVFAEETLQIDRLGDPVAAPITVGSRASPETMSSDAPEVVSVEPDGRLLAHGQGRATIRASTGGPLLRVEVAAVSEQADGETGSKSEGGRGAGAPTILPAKARLRPGEVQAFQALTPAGPLVGAWSSSDERVVAHLQDHLFQGLEPGRARVCVLAAGRSACAAVEVTP
jgi:hypothetical protein